MAKTKKTNTSRKTKSKSSPTKRKGSAKKTTAKKTTRKRKTKKPSLFKRLIKWLFVLGLWGAIILTAIIAYYASDLPDITENATFDRRRAIIVKDRSGDIIARYGDIVGNKVGIEDIPPYLVQAVLAIEDRRFYHHPGIDPIGLARAMAVNAKAGSVVQGGSTITQQLAKNLFLSRERTLKRKIQEALLALWLEYELTKDEILTAYLNRVYLGSGTYGVDAAARLYFHEPVQNLSLNECATIAGLLKAPSRYAPNRNPSLSKQRTQVVLTAMVDAGYITEDQATGESKLPPKPIQKPTNELTSRFYSDWIVDQLNDLIGTPEEDLIIETTLDSDIQDKATIAIDTTIGRFGAEKHMSQGAFIAMRPDGEVLAIVGGRNYSRSQFNRATQSLRPPGSSFKPILYLTALEKGWDIDDTIMDEPIKDSKYQPKNFGDRYYGEVTLEEAMTYSLNTAAVRLMKELGTAPVINSAKRLGITSELQPDLSLALGSSGVSLLEMANAYAIFANGGLQVQPYGILRITNNDGELYYERPNQQAHTRAFNSRNINDLTRMMGSVIEYGTGRGAAIGVPMGGKTGTSNESRDALFMGFTRNVVGVVWLGNDDNSSMKGVTGGSYPARIWAEVMAEANKRYTATPLHDNQARPSAFGRLIENLIFGGSNDEQQQERFIPREEIERRGGELDAPSSYQLND